MRQLPSLRAIQIFEAASRLQSFLHAADELGITPSAVSHQIRALEQELGITLFHRVNRTVILTDVGRRYSEEIAEALGQIETATRNLTRQSKSDILSILVVPSLGTQWLMPRMALFNTANPDIDVRLHTSGGPTDIVSGFIDLSIFYGSILPVAGVITEPFPDETIVAICSPRLMEGPHPIREPKDLQHHVLIHSELNLYRWQNWGRDQGVELDLRRGPRFDRSYLAISTAVDGYGVCLESRLLVERELADGKLILPFGNEGPKMHCHSLIYRRSRAHLPKLIAFRRWLVESLHESLG